MDTVLYLVIGIAWLVTGTFLLGQYGLRLLVNYGITNSTVTLLTIRSPAGRREVLRRLVPVIDPRFFRPTEHPANYAGDLARAGRV